MTKILLSSVISVPEYTPLSSQMDNILSTDLITLGSPSRLEKKTRGLRCEPRDLYVFVVTTNLIYL